MLFWADASERESCLSTSPSAIMVMDDVNLSRESQKKINTFAIRNAWAEELKEDLKVKQTKLKNLEDSEAEIMLQDDESTTIPIFIGESFVHFTQEKATEMVQESMVKTKAEIATLTERVDKIKQEMSILKTDLYSQFGDNINLENEED